MENPYAEFAVLLLVSAIAGEFSIIFISIGIAVGHVGVEALGLTTLADHAARILTADVLGQANGHSAKAPDPAYDETRP
jgi:hypothetical protein